AERLKQALDEALPIPCGNQDVFHPSLSMGIAAMKAGQTPETLVQAADRAMYRAKSSGKNCISE
ncbi:MAG TPA: diguanylate cyclase, partial [Syntrophorhabdaceae bacterium]|nr:diguanylate cyclase [Syntrophorhabdaceae bacterium]